MNGMTPHQHRHAVVIGASMGGLLAARALADHFEQVTLIERDTFPAPGEQRKGVPQGRHAHALLSRGREILEDFFPGLTRGLIDQGALLGDVGVDGRWFVDGGYHRRFASGLLALHVSRPRLEAEVRARLLSLPNVRAIERGDVLGLAGTLVTASTVDGTLELLADAPRPLKTRDRIRFHVGTSEVMARVLFLDRAELEPGQTAFARRPCLAYSTARVRVRARMPALLAPYAAA
jgi:hypothetical protein